ncbi:hypothetical protein J6S37_00510 [Candidatus Saccharibacteria bacterium]|nr:hypothetical protein [Candidatus Saccharibacteria bacterium]
MKKLIMCIACVVAAIIFFAEPTAELFPFQIMVAVIVCAVFYAKKRMGVEYEN